jgi:hypothetical protein
MEQLIDIFRHMPKDPGALSGFLNFTIHYALNDRRPWDEFRHPLRTIRSGWGDCDDYVAINYLWAYLNNYEPYMVEIKNGRPYEVHVFVWYKNEKGRVVVLNNSGFSIMGEGETVEDYIGKESPGYTETFNERM